MKRHQKLELFGGALAFLALFVEIFVFSIFYQDAKRGDDAVLEYRLNHIYYAVKGETYANPPWDKVEEFAKGPTKSWDNHLRFEEVYNVAHTVALVAFAIGGLMAFCGKYCEYQEKNRG